MMKGIFNSDYIFVIVVSLLFSGAIAFSILSNTPDKVVPCYDKYGSKIIGASCLQEGKIITLVDRVFIFIMFLIVFIGVGLWFVPGNKKRSD